MDFRKIDNLSVDCVLLKIENKVLKVLLRKRNLNLFAENLPVVDDWVLPGHYVLKSNNLGETANRVFEELTGEKHLNKNQFRAYGNAARINTETDLLWVRSRGATTRTITVAYYLILASNKKLLNSSGVEWFNIKDLPQLGFDHEKIITDAFNDIKSKINTEPLVFNFMPVKFTLNELQTVFEVLLDTELDNRNFRKKITSKSYIVPLEEKRKGQSKKPSRLYMFSNDVYNQIVETGYIINI
ncbi:NUDIX hydrolase [Tamlana sp. 62-3]|uniref:NUDIX hydrolase n=1 Tax=Neotamlana sargassicola TaxID=2883125 RepID=A0A9X1I872_9FLAO|nr:NUDIX hydrolase [Tamlana sargassicola]MCB4809258.1 NUDIX hydrolase [Tamlana sargassicola]